MKYTSLLLICILFFGIAPERLLSQAPQTISYQGVLTDAGGSAVPDGNYSLSFKLTTNPSNSIVLWEETHADMSVTGGVFNVILGSITSLDLPFDEPYWLGISVNNGEVLQPLIELTASPYSLHALSVADSVITGEKIAPGAALRSLNGLSDHVRLAAGDNITITSEDTTLVISALMNGQPSSPWLTSGNNIFYNNGNVGIGVDAPGARLHVNGGDMIIEDDFPVLILNGSGSNKIISFQINRVEQGNIIYSNGIGLQANAGADFASGSWVLDPDGNFGLGTSLPQRKLYVQFRNDNSRTSQMLVSQAAEGDAWMNFGLNGSTHYALGIDNSDDDKFKIGYTFSLPGGVDENTLMTITPEGNVGIKSSNPTARLHIGQGSQNVGTGLRFDDGANQAWDITHGFGLRLHFGGSLRGFFNANTGEYVQMSDLRLKNGIENMNEALSKVRQLKPRRYKYVGENNPISESSIGFIAQEIATLFPELVHYSEADDVYGIDYSGFGVVAIKAIQEQQAIIDNQQELIVGLSQRLEALEKKID